MIGVLEQGNPMGKVMMSVVLLEIIAIGLAIPVMIQVSHVDAATAGVAGGIVLLLCVVSGALFRTVVGPLLGWLSQLAAIALGLLTPLMFLVGLMFLALYAVCYVLGRRLESGRTERVAKLPPGRS